MSDNKKELNEIISLMKELIRSQEKMSSTLNDVLTLFKQYEIDEVMNSEDLREG